MSPQLAEQILLERHMGRVRPLGEKLEDETYEAASVGNVKRARYLEWVEHDMLPRGLAAADARYRARAPKEADPRILDGDVLISPRGTRWTASWSARSAKLVGTSPRGTTQTWWWRERSQLPKGWRLERNGREIQ